MRYGLADMYYIFQVPLMQETKCDNVDHQTNTTPSQETSQRSHNNCQNNMKFNNGNSLLILCENWHYTCKSSYNLLLPLHYITWPKVPSLQEQKPPSRPYPITKSIHNPMHNQFQCKSHVCTFQIYVLIVPNTSYAQQTMIQPLEIWLHRRVSANRRHTLIYMRMPLSTVWKVTLSLQGLWRLNYH
jgi:hypothetical protein